LHDRLLIEADRAELWVNATHRRSTCIFLVFLVSAAGCGRGSDSEAAEEYIQARAEGLQIQDDEDTELSASEAACFAAREVEMIEAEQLIEEDITPEEYAAASDLVSLDIDLPEDAVGQLADVMKDCAGDTVIEQFNEASASSVAAQMGIEDASCLTDEVDPNDVFAARAAYLVEVNDEIQLTFSDIVFESVSGDCLVDLYIRYVDTGADVGRDDENCLVDLLDPELLRDMFLDATHGEDVSARREAMDVLAAECLS
jgi:hypothetical protein